MESVAQVAALHLRVVRSAKCKGVGHSKTCPTLFLKENLIMSKRFFFLLTVIAICSLVVSLWLSRRNTTVVTANSQAQSFPMYVANYEEYVAPVGKPAELSRRVLRAQRSDGSFVEVEDTLSSDGKSHYTTRYIYRSDGTVVSLRDAQRIGVATAKTFRDRRTDPDRFDPARQCKVTFAGIANFQAATEMETVTSLGLKATRLDSDSPTVHHREWRVPTVDCLEVRRLAEFKGKDGAVTDTSDYTLVNLQMTEPPAALFEIPGDYESVTPTQFYERLMTLLGINQLDENTRKMLAPADANHVKNGIALSSLK
jgi:hypothetical protein